MYHTLNSNGSLTLHLDSDDQDTVETILDRTRNDHEMLTTLLDDTGYLGNAILIPIQPSNVAALTDAPMFSDDVDVEEDGTVLVKGNVWWYPQYELSSFMEVLKSTGQVTFTAASENATL